MAGSATLGRGHLPAVAVAVPAGLAGLGLAAALGAGAGATGPVRVLALLAGSLVVGLAVAPGWEEPRRRAELAARAWPLALGAAAVWLAAELAHLLLDAAAAAGSAVVGVDAAVLVSFVRDLSPGRADALALLAVLAVLALAGAAVRAPAVRAWAGVPVLALAAVALLARPATGHLGDSAVGVVAVAAHVGAAVLWCGGLAAVALLAGGQRATWTRLLPRFSPVALGCVGVLVVTGTLDAVLRLGTPAELLSTGYGRTVTAKVLAVLALVLLGRWARQRWVPGVAAHRVPAASSLRHAAVELVVMGLALGLASALAGSG